MLTQAPVPGAEASGGVPVAAIAAAAGGAVVYVSVHELSSSSLHTFELPP
jgi:hypothetical protein